MITTYSDSTLAKGELTLKIQAKIQAQEWTQTTDQFPEVGKKILAFAWRDKTVCQAWWNGENYILVAADEQGIVQVHQVIPAAISHWCHMPAVPAVSNTEHELIEQKLNGTMH